MERSVAIDTSHARQDKGFLSVTLPQHAEKPMAMSKCTFICMNCIKVMLASQDILFRLCLVRIRGSIHRAQISLIDDQRPFSQIDPKKVQLLPGGAAEKEVWLKRAKHIKKLNRAFDRLMRSKHLDEFDPTKGAVGVVREEPTDDAPVGKLRINEQSPPTSDAGPLNRPAPAKSDAVRKMEAVLKESRKAVKKGGLNKYSSGVR